MLDDHIRLLIADDHPLFRDRLVHTLTAGLDISVVELPSILETEGLGLSAQAE
jgi:DNA-binding NarL/FixJ family response regulator